MTYVDAQTVIDLHGDNLIITDRFESRLAESENEPEPINPDEEKGKTKAEGGHVITGDVVISLVRYNGKLPGDDNDDNVPQPIVPSIKNIIGKWNIDNTDFEVSGTGMTEEKIAELRQYYFAENASLRAMQFGQNKELIFTYNLPGGGTEDSNLTFDFASDTGLNIIYTPEGGGDGWEQLISVIFAGMDKVTARVDITEATKVEIAGGGFSFTAEDLENVNIVYSMTRVQ